MFWVGCLGEYTHNRWIGKNEFEIILSKIIENVVKNTRVSISVVVQKTEKVIADLPHEFGQLSEDTRSLEAMIAYLYMKYLRELGVL